MTFCANCIDRDATTTAVFDGRTYRVCRECAPTEEQPKKKLGPRRRMGSRATMDAAMAIARGLARPFTVDDIVRHAGLAKATAYDATNALVRAGSIVKVGRTPGHGGNLGAVQYALKEGA